MDNNRPVVSVIDEDNCIGCTKCVSVCPNEAIIGAKNFIHVIIEQWCYSCSACISVCPTDCISKINKASRPSYNVENFAKKNSGSLKESEDTRYFDIDQVDEVVISNELKTFLHEKD